MTEETAGTNSRCPSYRGVRLIEVSVKRELTVKFPFWPAELVLGHKKYKPHRSTFLFISKARLKRVPQLLAFTWEFEYDSCMNETSLSDRMACIKCEI